MFLRLGLGKPQDRGIDDRNNNNQKFSFRIKAKQENPNFN